MNISTTLTIEDLKAMGERGGFVFAANSRSSDEAIERLANLLFDAGVSESLPEVVARIEDGITAFVYPEGEHFNSAALVNFSNAQIFSGRFWQIDALQAFLKHQ